MKRNSPSVKRKKKYTRPAHDKEHKYKWDEWQQLFVCVHSKKCLSMFTPQEAASIINQLSEQGFYFQ